MRQVKKQKSFVKVFICIINVNVLWINGYSTYLLAELALQTRERQLEEGGGGGEEPQESGILETKKMRVWGRRECTIPLAEGSKIR